MCAEQFNENLNELTRPKREYEVLELFLQNKNDSEIAKSLYITEATVRDYIRNLKNRFQVEDRDDLIHLFIKHQPQMVSPSCRKKVENYKPEYPQGLVPLDSYFYILRNVENNCYEEIKNPGSLIRIKAPRFMGKTSLMLRILEQAKALNYQKVNVEISECDQKILQNPDIFFRWFCEMVTENLKLENKVLNFWQNQIKGNIKNCTDYFERYLLPKINEPLVLGLDELEKIFPYQETAIDFLTMLRLWHERAKKPNQQIWKNLRLIIINSTEVSVPLPINQSPFNVGFAVELPNFTPQEVKTLASRHQLKLTESELEKFAALISGHPYLIRLAFYDLAENKTPLQTLLEKAATQEGIYKKHLHELWEKLSKNPEILAGYKKAINAAQPVKLEPMLNEPLLSMGLIKMQGNNCLPYCDLYKIYFQNVL